MRVALTPSEITDFGQRGLKALNAGHIGEASGLVEDLLFDAPDEPNTLILAGGVAAERGRFAEAVGYFERALTQSPLFQPWLNDLCRLYRFNGQIDKAIEAGRKAVNVKDLDLSVSARINLGLAYVDAGDLAMAKKCFYSAVGFRPHNADARLGLAQVLLAEGCWAPGWREYEWRNEIPMAKEHQALPPFTSFPWNGMPLPDGRIVLIGDQGYGDTFMFARFVPQVIALCQEVHLGVSAEMHALLGRMPGLAGCCSRYQDFPPQHAAHARLTSLARLLDITDKNIPAAPYLTTDPDKVAAWRARLPSPGPRVGLVWKGRPTHTNDYRRSIKLAQLLPLADTGASFVSLQKPMSKDDGELLSAFPGATDFSDELTDWDQTAALVETLDLVITVDSGMAHLAGALDKPVWVMLPKTADFRWQVDRSDSVWYDSATLFRQQQHNDWSQVITEIGTRLTEMAADAKARSLRF